MKKVSTNFPIPGKSIKRDKDLYGYVDKTTKSIAKKISEKINSAQADEGGLVFIDGPVCSGKTLVGMHLIETLSGTRRRAVPIQPRVDRPDVPEGKLFSRSGYEIKAISYNSKKEIEKIFHNYDVVIIDEVQFTPAALQSYLLKEIRLFTARGGWVAVLALLYTSLGTEFLISTVLKEEAIMTFELKATCQMCGRRNARLDQRLVNNKPAPASSPDLMPPSEKVVYEPRCADCYVVVGD